MAKARGHGERRGCEKKGRVSSFKHTAFECWPTPQVGQLAENVQPEHNHGGGLGSLSTSHHQGDDR